MGGARENAAPERSPRYEMVPVTRKNPPPGEET
jgi:hypothetical protein